MKLIPLVLKYKGTRQYIHGTDMMNEAYKVLSQHFPDALEKISFSIHKMTAQNLSINLCQTDASPVMTENDVAVLTFQTAGAAWQAKWVEQNNTPSERYPYDEDVFLALCHIDFTNHSIILKHDSPYTIIETIVAMTKQLHLKIFPEVTSQWVFCRWVSSRWPHETMLIGLEVRIKQKLGAKLTSCEVRLQGESLGQIYFSTRDKS